MTVEDLATELLEGGAELYLKFEGQWVAKVICAVLPYPLYASTDRASQSIEVVLRMLRSHLAERAKSIPREKLS